MTPLYTSLVRSRLEYCSPLWNPSKVADIMKFESIQRTFTSKVSEVRHLSYWQRLKSLDLMSLQRRRERYSIIHIFKILNQLAPNDLQLIFYETGRRGICCKVPPLVKNSKSRFQSLYDDSFAVTGARLWNLIPKIIKRKDSPESFKSALTKHIMLIPDHPPVPGISSQNSLLHLLASDTTTWNTGDDDTVGGLDEERSRMS